MTQKLVNFEIIRKNQTKQTENEISVTVSKQKKLKKVKSKRSQKRKFLLEKTLNMGTKFFLSPNDFSF